MIGWHENGQKKEESNWKDGKKNGEATTYDKNGNETLRQKWDLGTLVFEKKIDEKLITQPPVPTLPPWLKVNSSKTKEP